MDTRSAADSSLAGPDVRRIVRLLGDVIAATGDIDDKRRLLMDGLCEIVSAAAWVWSSEAVPCPSSLEFTDGDVHLTRPGGQMDPEHLLDQPTAAPWWTRTNIGPLIMSRHPMEGGGVNTIRIFRTLDDPHFTDRETKIAHIVLSEIPWLHFSAFPNQASRNITYLYPRHHTVLNLLGDGWSRKKIADHLGISLNTVHGYTKALFKHFGVHSQSELLARFPKAMAEANETHPSGGS